MKEDFIKQSIVSIGSMEGVKGPRAIVRRISSKLILGLQRKNRCQRILIKSLISQIQALKRASFPTRPVRSRGMPNAFPDRADKCIQTGTCLCCYISRGLSSRTTARAEQDSGQTVRTGAKKSLNPSLPLTKTPQSQFARNPSERTYEHKVGISDHARDQPTTYRKELQFETERSAMCTRDDRLPLPPLLLARLSDRGNDSRGDSALVKNCNKAIQHTTSDVVMVDAVMMTTGPEVVTPSRGDDKAELESLERAKRCKTCRDVLTTENSVATTKNLFVYTPGSGLKRKRVNENGRHVLTSASIERVSPVHGSREKKRGLVLRSRVSSPSHSVDRSDAQPGSVQDMHQTYVNLCIDNDKFPSDDLGFSPSDSQEGFLNDFPYSRACFSPADQSFGKQSIMGLSRSGAVRSLQLLQNGSHPRSKVNREDFDYFSGDKATLHYLPSNRRYDQNGIFEGGLSEVRV